MNIVGRTTAAPDGADDINLQWLCNVTVLGQTHYFLIGFGAGFEATVGLGAEEGFTEDCGLDEVTGLWDCDAERFGVAAGLCTELLFP